MNPRRVILTIMAATLLLTTGTSCRKSMTSDARSELAAPQSIQVDMVPTATSRTNSSSPLKIYVSDERIAETKGARASDRFADIPLLTHEGQSVRFVGDLIRDKIVVINLTYTRCRGSCPATNARIIQLRRLLAPEFGKRIAFLSISIDPEHDTPQVLADFSARFRKNDTPDLPPWLFLTGNHDDIEDLRFSLGLFDPDPLVDADRTNHAGLLTYGNDRTDRWSAIPSDMSADEIAQTITRIAGETNNQRYAGLYSSHTVP